MTGDYPQNRALGADLLQDAAGNRAIIQVQNPIRLSEYSEPEPDIALALPRADFYKSAHPGPADVLLVIEVAESTLLYDRTIKAPLYARHGIPECWIIDLGSRKLERYREPRELTYARVDRPDLGQPIAPAALPNSINRPVFALGELLEGMTPEAMHDAFDWGEDLGREVVE